MGRDEDEENIYDEITENLDYYTGTEEGRAQLIEEHKRREKKFIEELLKYFRPQRDVIWMSSYCRNCIYFVDKGGAVARCELNDSKLVKPFHGTAIWKVIKDVASGVTTLEIEEIKWDEKWLNKANEEIENAMRNINSGRPYECYVPRRGSQYR